MNPTKKYKIEKNISDISQIFKEQEIEINNLKEKNRNLQEVSDKYKELYERSLFTLREKNLVVRKKMTKGHFDPVKELYGKGIYYLLNYRDVRNYLFGFLSKNQIGNLKEALGFGKNNLQKCIICERELTKKRKQCMKCGALYCSKNYDPTKRCGIWIIVDTNLYQRTESDGHYDSFISLPSKRTEGLCSNCFVNEGSDKKKFLKMPFNQMIENYPYSIVVSEIVKGQKQLIEKNKKNLKKRF